MAKIEDHDAYTWDELRTKIDRLFGKPSDYYFRGQSDADWRIESSLTRSLSDHHLKDKDVRMRLTQQHLDQFTANLRGRTTLDPKDPNTGDDDIWALGRHFGLDTPLLDWTYSPYVALFFSLQDEECKSGMRSIWAISHSAIERINAPLRKKGKAANIVRVINPLTHDNPRLVSQRGLFLKIPVGQYLENWVEDGEEGADSDPISMHKIKYTNTMREEALFNLLNMNISYLSLFPDLEGSSRHSNFQLKFGLPHQPSDD